MGEERKRPIPKAKQLNSKVTNTLKIYSSYTKRDILFMNEDMVQCLAKVFGPLELCDLLPHFRLQT